MVNKRLSNPRNSRMKLNSAPFLLIIFSLCSSRQPTREFIQRWCSFPLGNPRWRFRTLTKSEEHQRECTTIIHYYYLLCRSAGHLAENRECLYLCTFTIYQGIISAELILLCKKHIFRANEFNAKSQTATTTMLTTSLRIPGKSMLCWRFSFNYSGSM